MREFALSPPPNTPLPPPRPVLLFYCQHSLGIGHLTRSFALARTLAELFRVVFLNGGPLPAGSSVPHAIELVDLPPLGMDDGHNLVSRSAAQDVLLAQLRRHEIITEAARMLQPALVLIELFPFGRKKFAGEILALIRAARGQRPDVRVVCSLRDILVDGRRDQQHHDDRARWLANRYFDAVLVHSDPAFARIEDSFRPARPLAVPVHYTGYVVPARAADPVARRDDRLLVSAGGGIVGFPLFAAALAAHALRPTSGLQLRIVVGPFLPDAEWVALQGMACGRADVELVRHVPDLAIEMRRARLSVSQCGYNTALDIVVAGVPALVVPYAAPGENEQSRRAEALAALGAVRHLPAEELEPARLAIAIDETLAFSPRPAALALDGAQRSAELLARLMPIRNSGVARSFHA